ncbi:hypothetical protein B5M09_004787 [Aphanomyces astaci]|uniref:Uncharacterized protein n=1 Tax=Aphanomyces astaci TaxID=112090 RepID=A0A3R7XR67_APHAT|nr:hypothetical protein B5M09_004787 [Aphanomyces astaci]
MSSDNNHLRVQYEALLKENKQLKGVVEKLEKENHDLKRSVYELSLNNIGSSSSSAETGPSVFNANDLLAKNSATETTPSYLESLTPNMDDDDQQASNPRIFFQKSELRGHGVLLWDVTTKFNQQQLASLGQHSQLVIDVSWSNDSRSLLSASYDHTVKLWDVEKASLTGSVGVNGLVQTVSFNPADNDMYFIGTSQRNVHVLDVRAGVTQYGVLTFDDRLHNSFC